jgi:hypothetical protein
MKDGDITPVLLGVAVFATAYWFHTTNTDLQTQLNNCHVEFQSFKEGVVYGR